MIRLAITDVQPDDLILWCGRVVEVVDMRPAYSRRPGRWLVCDIGNDDHLRDLHYFDDEVVTVHHLAAR